MLGICSQVIVAVCALVGSDEAATAYLQDPIPAPPPQFQQKSDSDLFPPANFRPVTLPDSDNRPPPLEPTVLAEPPAWYGSFDVGFLKPHITDKAGPPLPAPLDWAVAPKIMAGYQLPQARGNLELTYRGLGTSGNSILPNFDALGSGVETSRLDLQTLSLDYLMPEFVPGGAEINKCFHRQLVAGIGVGSTSIFNDSGVVGREIIAEHLSTTFWGVGPRGVLFYSQPLGNSPWSLYARGQSSGLWGQIHTDFFAEQIVDPPNFRHIRFISPGAVGISPGTVTTGVAMLSGEFGVSYAPPNLPQLRLSTGYYLENWWFLGSSGFVAGSEIFLQGVFLRAQYRY